MTSSKELQVVILYTLYKKAGKASDERTISFIKDGGFLKEGERDNIIVTTGEDWISNRIRYEVATLKELGQIEKRTIGEKGVWRLSDAGRDRVNRAAKYLFNKEIKDSLDSLTMDYIWERFTPKFLELMRELGAKLP